MLSVIAFMRLFRRAKATARAQDVDFQFIPYRLHVPDAMLDEFGTSSIPVIGFVSPFQ
jgi:hypothetical protein